MVIASNIDLDRIKNSGCLQVGYLKALIHGVYCGVSFARSASDGKGRKAFVRKIKALGIRYKCLSWYFYLFIPWYLFCRFGIRINWNKTYESTFRIRFLCKWMAHVNFVYKDIMICQSLWESMYMIFILNFKSRTGKMCSRLWQMFSDQMMFLWKFM